MILRLDELLVLHKGVVLGLCGKTHSRILGFLPLASVEGDDEIDPLICHCRHQLLVIESHQDRTYVLGVSVTQFHSLRNRHTLDIIEDQFAVLVHTLCNKGEVDFQAGITQCPREVRHLGICLAS